MAVSVFVSYSHNDVALVTPVVKLLRLNESLVFQDTDSIELGKKWREQGGRALADMRLVEAEILRRDVSAGCLT